MLKKIFVFDRVSDPDLSGFFTDTDYIHFFPILIRCGNPDLISQYYGS